MNARLSVAELRRLLVEIYTNSNDTKGTETLQAALENEVAEIRGAERRST